MIVEQDYSDHDNCYEVVQVWAVKDINGQKLLTDFDTKDQAETAKSFLDRSHKSYWNNKKLTEKVE